MLNTREEYFSPTPGGILRPAYYARKRGLGIGMGESFHSTKQVLMTRFQMFWWTLLTVFVLGQIDVGKEIFYVGEPNLIGIRGSV